MTIEYKVSIYRIQNSSYTGYLFTGKWTEDYGFGYIILGGSYCDISRELPYHGQEKSSNLRESYTENILEVVTNELLAIGEQEALRNNFKTSYRERKG